MFSNIIGIEDYNHIINIWKRGLGNNKKTRFHDGENLLFI